jgi:hypothetical protein
MSVNVSPSNYHHLLNGPFALVLPFSNFGKELRIA